ncbi:EF-Hand 1 calcium-binding site [Trinorchestia longiramus]|nr:EF-Hand 1 calcium-binding site [Trinorchestia longiramus]
MKIQLLMIAGLFALSSGLPIERSCDELKSQLSRRLQAQAENSQARLQAPVLSVRSCDGDGDGALTALEFAGCLQRLTSTERERGADDLTSKRAACIQSFMAEADEDVDNA